MQCPQNKKDTACCCSGTAIHAAQHGSRVDESQPSPRKIARWRIAWYTVLLSAQLCASALMMLVRWVWALGHPGGYGPLVTTKGVPVCYPHNGHRVVLGLTHVGPS